MSEVAELCVSVCHVSDVRWLLRLRGRELTLL